MYSSENLQKILKLVTLGCLIIIIGIIASLINNKINNNKYSKINEVSELAKSKSFTLNTEQILACYNPKTEVASEELISRSARIREEANCIPIEEISISRNMDLTVRCNITKSNFILLMSNLKYDTSNFFEENAETIYDLCKQYELNEIFFCGLISAESGWNIASNHRSTHNYISLMSSNGLIHFSSTEEGLEKAASTLHNRYLSEGGSFYFGKTLEAVRTRFCPVNPDWTSLVYGRMAQILE